MSAEDDDLVRRMAAELDRCEAPLEVVLRPVSAFHLAGLLQLALRHPHVEPTSRTVAWTFIEHVRAYFGDHDADAVLDVLRRGDDPREDRS
jgi:hypothetical protein